MTIDPKAAPTAMQPTGVAAHPEDLCDDCGKANPTWHAPNDLWNTIMGSSAGIVCPTCFAVRAQANGLDPVWILSPAAPTAMQPDGLVERYASRSDELAEGGEYPWWSGLAELLRSQAAHIDRLEADLREARMQALASDGQAQEALALVAVAEVTGWERAALDRTLRSVTVWDKETGVSSRFVPQARLEADVARLTKERDDLAAANDAIEVDAGLAKNGNLWRYWSIKSQTLATKNKAMREAGAQLANCAYNLSQPSQAMRLEERTRATLKECCEAWDRATLSSIKEPTT